MSSADLSIDISKVVARTFSGEAVDATAAAEALAVKHADLGMSADLIGKAIVRAAGMVRQAAMQPALAPPQPRIHVRPPMPAAPIPFEPIAAPVQPRRPDVFAASTWTAQSAAEPPAAIQATALAAAAEPVETVVFPAMRATHPAPAGRVDLIDTLEAALENAFLADFQSADIGHARVTEPTPDFNLDEYLDRRRDAGSDDRATTAEPSVRKIPARPAHAAFSGSPIEEMRRALRRA